MSVGEFDSLNLLAFLLAVAYTDYSANCHVCCGNDCHVCWWAIFSGGIGIKVLAKIDYSIRGACLFMMFPTSFWLFCYEYNIRVLCVSNQFLPYYANLAAVTSFGKLRLWRHLLRKFCKWRVACMEGMYYFWDYFVCISKRFAQLEWNNHQQHQHHQ